MVLNNKQTRLLKQATRKFGFIDDPIICPMFQTEDLQKQHEILNEVARLIDLGMIKPL
jgi:hypothetical protein